MSFSEIGLQARRKFMEHHSRCYDILSASVSQMTFKLSLELYAVMYVISDYAAFGYENNRKAVSNALLSKILLSLSMENPQFTSDMMRKRVMFYLHVVEGMELHAHGLMGRDVSDAHPVLRCAIAFTDCCLYPAYIEDYNAPRPTLSALDVMDFSFNVMEPLNTVFASLYKDICDICSYSAPAQPNKSSAPAKFTSPIEKDTSSKPSPSTPKESLSTEDTVSDKDSDPKLFLGLTFLAGVIILLSVLAVVFGKNPSSSGKKNNSPVSMSPPTSTSTQPATQIPSIPRPRNGQITLYPRAMRVSPFSVETESTYDYYFVFIDCKTGAKVMCFYAHGGTTVELNVPVGTFDIYYACGNTWYGANEMFGPSTIYQKCDESFEFTEDSGWTLQLQPVSFGNLDTEYVSPDEFPK